MSTLDQRIEEMTTGIQSLASELRDKQNIGLDRIKAIEDEITKRDSELEELLTAKRTEDTESRIKALESRLTEFRPSAKAAAIMAGVSGAQASGSKYDMNGAWLKALVDRRYDPAAAEFVKANGDLMDGILLKHDREAITAAAKGVLGTSDATGQAIVPNNFVAALELLGAQSNIYRGLMNVVTGVRGAGVDIPYEVTAIGDALLQGAYGSNKDIRDFSFNQATATLYTIAQIADIGNQLLRQSEGAAEQVARRRLGLSIGQREASFIINGTGSSQPLGILQAFLGFGDIAKYKYALSSETRASALGNGLSKLESNFETATAIVMNPTDFWEMTTETLGSSGSGGWAMDPTGGATTPRVSVWGVPVYRDTTLTVGTALVGNFGACDIFLGDGYRIDVSSEAGNRFDQNVTGFRAEEEFAFNAEPYVRTNKFVKVTGL